MNVTTLFLPLTALAIFLTILCLRTPWLGSILVFTFSQLMFGNEVKATLGPFSLNLIDYFLVFTIFGSMAALATGRTRTSPIPRSYSFPALALVAWLTVELLLSAFFKAYPLADTLKDLRVFLYLLSCALLFSRAMERPESERTFHWAFILTTLGVCLEILAVIGVPFVARGELTRNVAINALPIPLFILFYYAFMTRLWHSRHRMLLTSTVFLCLIALVLTETRSIILQLVSSIGLLHLLKAFQGKAYSLWPAFVFLGGTVCVGLSLIVGLRPSLLASLVDRFVSLNHWMTDSSMSSRIVELRSSWPDLAADPVFGQGLGFRSLASSPHGMEMSLFQHNAFVYYGLKVGLVGVGLVVWLCWAIMHRSHSRCRTANERHFYVAAILPLLVFQTQNALLNYVPSLVFFLAVASLAHWQPEVGDKAQGRQRAGPAVSSTQ
ncbi:MAG: O-antigen ligase family protein [Candidatus Marsarchaeota archaeon]|nr:O-antigen ligase family protein [Candidatus Marsarchaeota archaeon]